MARMPHRVTLNSVEIAANAESMIDLTWRQKIAAFWSISWPCWLASFVLVSFVIGNKSRGELENESSSLGLVANIAFLVLRFLLIPRLVRKKYRSFRIFVVRGDDQPVRGLSANEAVRVWLQIVWPQVLFLAGTALMFSLESSTFSPATIQSLSSLGLWIRVLVIGPSAIQFAMRARYGGFRLQAYGYRLI